MFGSNSSNSFSNQTSVAFQDRALTAADQTLLVQIRQTVISRLQPVGAWSPAVHFQVNNGVVTLMGAVTTVQISQQVETTVTQVPGVVRVVNRLVVGNGTGTGAIVVPTLQTNATSF
jgi:osmotically-inducible protein OsmY